MDLIEIAAVRLSLVGLRCPLLPSINIPAADIDHQADIMANGDVPFSFCC